MEKGTVRWGKGVGLEGCGPDVEWYGLKQVCI